MGDNFGADIECGAGIRLRNDAEANCLDGQIIDIIRKSLPLEEQYDELALYLRGDGGNRKNWLKSRRQRERAQFRPKKNRSEKFERLDDLYFLSCAMCHRAFPSRGLWGEFIDQFNPCGIPQLTMELIYQLLAQKIRQSENENATYQVQVECGQKQRISLRFETRGPALPLDLACLWAIVHLDWQGENEACFFDKQFLDAIAALNEPSLNREIAARKALSTNALDAIWATHDMETMRMLASNPEFAVNINDEQACEIMNAGDRELLQNLETNFRKLRGVKKEIKLPRLSPRKHERLMEYFASASKQ